MAEITVIGGINIDIEGYPFAKLRAHDSNPGKICLSHGGVGRNIVENTARLGGSVAMLSVIGDDPMGKGAKEELVELGVDVSMVETIQGRNTSMYLSILDEEGDMELALSDMDIIENISREMLGKYEEKLRASKVIALDGNLSRELLAYAVELFEGIPLFYDPVSAAKALRGKEHIGRFHSIKPNVMEAEALSGMSIDGEEDVLRVAKYFMTQGVKQVFITLNKDGVFYMDELSHGFIRPAENLKIESATGAGDSFSAMVLLGMVAGRSAEETAKMGMAASAVTMETSRAVNKQMNIQEIIRRI